MLPPHRIGSWSSQILHVSRESVIDCLQKAHALFLLLNFLSVPMALSLESRSTQLLGSLHGGKHLTRGGQPHSPRMRHLREEHRCPPLLWTTRMWKKLAGLYFSSLGFCLSSPLFLGPSKGHEIREEHVCWLPDLLVFTPKQLSKALKF